MNMRKLFAAILLMATSSIFAETWTQTLKGYDCRGSCRLYADTSNVLYGKHLITSDDAWFWNTSSLFFNDSQIVFGNKSYDYGEPDVLPGQIIFSYKPTMSGCRIPESYYEHQCEYGLSVVFKDTSDTLSDSLWIQKETGFAFDDTLNLVDTNRFNFIKPEERASDNPIFLADLFEEKIFSWNFGVYKNSSTGDSIYYRVAAALDSIFFVYRKDSAYFAYCRLLQARTCNSFQIQCIFQTDRLPYFPSFELEEYPYPCYALAWYRTEGGDKNYSYCNTLEKIGDFLYTTTPIPSRRRFTPKNGEEKSYQLNGCPNSGNHTGVIIENGKVKVQLKK